MFELRYDTAEQARRGLKGGDMSLQAQLVRQHTKAIIEDLKEIKLSTSEIAKKYSISASTIGRIAREAGIDLKGRSNKMRRKYQCTISQGDKLNSRIHESMTQDGVSLKWLSMKW